MALLNKNFLLEMYGRRQSYLATDQVEKNHSRKMLKESSENFSMSKSYDIFLSHSYDDARIIEQIQKMLIDKGYSVYVDWIDDGHLNRSSVDGATAKLLRNRMDQCHSLIYITSESATTSVWMPWELGYMDARTRKVAVAPIVSRTESNFDGREYLGLYPYLDLSGDSFYIHASIMKYVGLQRWMNGENPETQ